MADPLRDVSPGQPVADALFDSRRVNAWNLAARLARDRAGQVGGGEHLGGVTPTLTAYVRNDTGGALDARAVLAPGNALVSTTDSPFAFQAQPVFAAAAPADADDLVFVTLEPIAADAVGRAVVSGLAVVDVNVTDAGHEFAAPIADDTAKLASADAGLFRIITRQSGTGVKRAVVLFGGGGTGPAGSANSFDIVTAWTIDDSTTPCTIVPSLVRTITGVFVVGEEHAP